MLQELALQGVISVLDKCLNGIELTEDEKTMAFSLKGIVSQEIESQKLPKVKESITEGELEVLRAVQVEVSRLYPSVSDSDFQLTGVALVRYIFSDLVALRREKIYLQKMLDEQNKDK